MGSINNKKKGRKSRDTAPLSSLLGIKEKMRIAVLPLPGKEGRYCVTVSIIGVKVRAAMEYL